MMLIDLPTPHVGSTYANLFSDLVLHHSMLPLGVLCGKDETRDNMLPFVCTNPQQDMILAATDRVYCLGSHS